MRAIAKGVFGIHTVVWNHDSTDWAIGSNPKYTSESVNAEMQKWITGPKTPGLMILEHERSAESVKVFTDNYASIISNGWKLMNIVSLDVNDKSSADVRFRLMPWAFHGM